MKIAYPIFSRFNRVLTGKLKFDGGNSGSFDPNNIPSGGFNSDELTPQKQNESKSFAITALVTGIISLVFNCCSCGMFAFILIPEILAIVSIVFAVLDKKRRGSMSGMAIGGLVCAVLSLVISLAILALTKTPYFQEQWQAYESVFESIMQAQGMTP